ncbi:hypothetical protein ACM46_00860 [Chryseobacterium angstadtii]|uniref:Uncharacterized protein n=1 Tax=Chryseobacterium angstadtii TaxID=558151 RepID=A0A0J7IJH4_9FLAO|nr:hypothetical protein [Chryseobacterium angstadtii]KMQ66146.1 hypothetical protein ACM46_00860 [Chryseobacterium angstadtii]
MEKQLFAENSACEEIKKRLIEKIKSLECKDLYVFEKERNLFINEIFFLEPLGDHPISAESKNGQVIAAEKVFPLFPDKFTIKKIGDVIDLYRNTVKYMYVYFLYEGNDVNIAFLFKDDFYMGDIFDITNGDKLYVLRNNALILQTETEYPDIINAVRDFEGFFNHNYSQNKFTKYIIYNMDLVNRNFNSFDEDTEILIGAMPYGVNIDRPNLILKIHESRVGIKVYEVPENHYYFFNMGHLYP